MKLFKFSGNVKDLKNIGFSFQKLYANNYKTYKKENIIMYVNNNMIIEIDKLDFNQHYHFIDFILSNKDKDKSFWFEDIILELHKNINYDNSPKWYISETGNILSSSKKSKLNSIWYQELLKIINEEDNNLITTLEAKEKRNLANQLEGALDFFAFDKDTLDIILSLDTLNSLDFIEFT